MGTSREDARAEKARAAEVFGQIATVVGVGIIRINDGYGLKVNLSEQPAPGIVVPQEINGVPVRVEVIGAIRKQ